VGGVAITEPTVGASPPVTPLTSSTTFVPKATYVPLTVPGRTGTGAASQKFAYVRSLNLQPGEVDALQAALSVAYAPSDAVTGEFEGLALVLKRFEGTPLTAQLPPVSAFADIPVSELVTFGNALSSVRAKTVTSGSAGTGTAERATPGAAEDLLNTSLVLTQGLANSSANPAVGMLNLERLEMTPAGLQRGALLATIPLAPQERTSVMQREWSVTDQEFTSIVTDSLTDYSETGVTENTQLTQATNSQVSHSNQFNISASASGGIGFVSGSVSTGFSSQDQNSASASDSRTHALQTTQQASSRVTQSHKTSFSISTTTGESEASTRVLFNPSSTDAMRVDYFSIMRTWYVALYRYGLRLTYDITVPEPGAALRESYRQLAELQTQAAQGFSLPVSPSQITQANWEMLADQFQATLTAPPPATMETSFVSPYSVTDISGFTYTVLTLNLPEGYSVSSAKLTANQAISGGTEWPIPFLNVMFVGELTPPADYIVSQDVTADLDYLVGRYGTQYVTYGVSESASGVIEVDVTLQDAGALAAWQEQAWAVLNSAAQTAYYANQQTISAQISALQQQIDSVDTLTLRREEHDEIMKTVLRWLLGPFEVFMPAQVSQELFQGQPGADLEYGIDFTGSNTTLTTFAWTTVENYEAIVNFINQAVDWDNIIYFLYSYFWDVPESWDFIRQIQHPDSTRQAFLRAGSARVILTVRKGWELAWAYFVAYGSTVLPEDLPSHPYLTIAQQIADYDSTNYPGIPAADPNNPDPLGDDETQPVGTTSTEVLAASASPVTITVADITGFVVGASAIIDTFASGFQETQTITAVGADTITVAALTNAHSPANNGNDPYPVVQAGSKGLLIGEWFEYTPTSGIDIAVNSDLSTIA
jgi:hypothetical protein